MKLQMNICVTILHIFGFTSIYKDERIKLNWEDLHKWYYNNQQNIKVLFDDSMYVTEIYNETIKTTLMKSINNKLDMIF